MSLFTNVTVATNAFLIAFEKSKTRSFSTGLIAIAAALPLAAGLTGCGGGGGVGAPADATKDVTSTTPNTPVISAPATPSTPAANLGTGSFVPNYNSELVAARRWEKKVVTVAFTAPLDANGNVRNVGPLVQQAIEHWNRKVGQEVSFQLTNAADADIQIRWVAPSSLSGDAIGRTEVRFRNVDQVLISATVSVEQSLPDTFQVQVLAHELGHSLGIEGHSTVPSDLMYPNAHLPVEVTTRDQNTIRKAYFTDPSRSVQPVAPGAGVSTATSAAQYVCESNELRSHRAHSH